MAIINPNVAKNWDNLPLGNALFPELVDAVFELESKIASQDRVDSITVENSQYSVTITDRQPSSHCA